ncbi:uncharacterized protein LOC130138280 [Syzygium oleosum]|uniref:uncharacterized protein LOC130138280 n=1 Tax=Syzygium oleosum TaxID=219896 RepID=UPI0024BBCBAE|nr:uncharacterized protein LOC130138280 [Syzygium oleosum]
MCNDISMDTNLFQCVIPLCFRSFHFNCSPFPWSEMIKSKCHFRPLTFAKTFLEDDSGEYYCNASETERNPKHPVYRCMQCDYIAHVSCTISEVLPLILAEYEMDAKLRENLANDAGLQRIDMKIRGLRDEEMCLAKE